MYLVELRPGREELYRSSDELALAIRNGDVDARSRIYHRATAKWISITLHPQYKAIITAPKEEPPARPVRKGWTFLGGIAPAPQPAAEVTVSNGSPLHRWRGPMALGISGLLLMLGIQLASSGPRPPWAGRARVVAARPSQPRHTAIVQPETESRQEIVTLASTATAWPAEDPSVPDSAVTVVPEPPKVKLLPRAPRLRAKLLRVALAPGKLEKAEATSIDAMLSRYAAAHDSAQIVLEGGMRVARLSRLFSASRLSPNGGITDTRMSLAGAANFIRVYRKQQAVIEVAYQDSVNRFTKQYRWTPKQVQQWSSRSRRTEEPTLEVLSGSLLQGIDSLLGVLDAQAGAYKIRGTAIAFEDPSAAKAYGALRRRIMEQIDQAVAASGATSAGPTGLLLQAIGTSTLPRET
jgi:hypothetical protein